jgi:hypothetical protein
VAVGTPHTPGGCHTEEARIQAGSVFVDRRRTTRPRAEEGGADAGAGAVAAPFLAGRHWRTRSSCSAEINVVGVFPRVRRSRVKPNVRSARVSAFENVERATPRV